MLDFDLRLTKADTERSLAYKLINRLDSFLSGENYRERRVGPGVAVLEPNHSASESIGKIKSVLVKIAMSGIRDDDMDELVLVLKEHGYQFGFDKQPNPFDTRVVINTPRGVLSFPLMSA